MAELAALTQPQPAAGLPLAEQSLTHAQLPETACIACGTSEEALHRGETITTSVSPGVVRDTQVLRCTRCLLASRTARYEAMRLPDPINGHHWWAIFDHRAGKWALNNGETERFPWRDGALGWIRRQVYIDQFAPSSSTRSA